MQPYPNRNMQSTLHDPDGRNWQNLAESLYPWYEDRNLRSANDKTSVHHLYQWLSESRGSSPCTVRVLLIWSTANLLQCNSYITMKINWVLHMETIHAPPATVRIRNRTALITVEILALPPSRTDIVFNSRTTQRRKLLVSVNVEFDFTFSPPSGLVCLIGKDTHANSQKRPLPDSWGRTV